MSNSPIFRFRSWERCNTHTVIFKATGAPKIKWGSRWPCGLGARHARHLVPVQPSSRARVFQSPCSASSRLTVHMLLSSALLPVRAVAGWWSPPRCSLSQLHELLISIRPIASACGSSNFVALHGHSSKPHMLPSNILDGLLPCARRVAPAIIAVARAATVGQGQERAAW